VQQGLQFEDWLGAIKSDLLGLGKSGSHLKHRVAFQFGAGRVFFRTASPVNSQTLVEPDGRILDANRDALRDVVVDALKKPSRATLPTPLLFEPGVTELSTGHLAFLAEVSGLLVTGRFTIRVDGYSFDEGVETGRGWELAEARARNTRDVLVENGIDPLRIQWAGFGMMHFGPETQLSAAPLPQNLYGRRAVLITLLY
jgi:outer membrane protein OmpA-like peptidoglycan-associated protein